jgi:hypothetical protein
MSTDMNVPGYEHLADILTAAYTQAAVGKGAERHAGGQPFDKQPMQSISDLFDTPYGMAFQVAKKLHEGIKMDTLERQERELLGVINYTAGIILWLRRQAESESPQGELLLGGVGAAYDQMAQNLPKVVYKPANPAVCGPDSELAVEIESKVAAAGGWVNVPDTGWVNKWNTLGLCQVRAGTPIFYKHEAGHLGQTSDPQMLKWSFILAYREQSK